MPGGWGLLSRCLRTSESIHFALKNEGGCTMEIVCAGAQYRENPGFWSAPLATRRVYKPVQSNSVP